MKVERTEFGKANSTFRRTRGLKLREVAEHLGVTPAFLTNVEVGRKSVPEEWYERLAAFYKLDKLQRSLLRHAGLKSQKRFVIEIENENEAELLAAFIENRECLGADQIQKAISDLSVGDSEDCEDADAAA
ncbi:MAG: helix-turn-helix transcriptional regulator [Rhodobacter sp.]|nr:helix-turn-helix transcriptional regulator [Rhodobacter sp.]